MVLVEDTFNAGREYQQLIDKIDEIFDILEEDKDNPEMTKIIKCEEGYEHFKQMQNPHKK